MGKQIKAGEKLPFFKYDTPYSAANSFRQLLAEHAPLVLVFMSNFGHPITRTFVGRYAATYDELTGGSLALVVRSRADRLARSVGPDTLPYPLLCDADGVLYDLLDIPTRSGALSTYSLEAWQIMRDAKRLGYHSPAYGQQQLPLTLVLDKDGTTVDLKEDEDALDTFNLSRMDADDDRHRNVAEDAEFEASGFEFEDAPEDAGADVDVDFDDE